MKKKGGIHVIFYKYNYFLIIIISILPKSKENQSFLFDFLFKKPYMTIARHTTPLICLKLQTMGVVQSNLFYRKFVMMTPTQGYFFQSNTEPSS
jgi:hypothetical protein